MTDLNEKMTKIIEDAEKRGLGHFGIRAEDKIFEIGASLRNSHQWGDDWNGEELDGTCAVQISYDGWDVEDIESDIEEVSAYADEGRKIILIGGTASYEGTDYNETVIRNAEVLYVFE